MMSDEESNPAALGASNAPILTENGSRELEHAPPPPESDAGVGSDAVPTTEVSIGCGKMLGYPTEGHLFHWELYHHSRSVPCRLLYFPAQKLLASLRRCAIENALKTGCPKSAHWLHSWCCLQTHSSNRDSPNFGVSTCHFLFVERSNYYQVRQDYPTDAPISERK